METKEEGGEGDRDKEEMARLRTHMPHEQTSLSEEESHLCGCLKLTGSRNLKPLLVGEEEGWSEHKWILPVLTWKRSNGKRKEKKRKGVGTGKGTIPQSEVQGLAVNLTRRTSVLSSLQTVIPAQG